MEKDSHNPYPGSVHSGYSGPASPTHQTVVTMSTDPNPGINRTEINLNIGYFTTLPGWIKIIQLVSLFKIFYKIYFLKSKKLGFDNQT